MRFADPAGDQLCVLGAEVDDENRVVIGRRSHTAAYDTGYERTTSSAFWKSFTDS